MNAAMMISDNTRATSVPQAGDRAKAASESAGDEPQQRFADVLPLAQAAMEQTSNADQTDKAPAKTRPPKGEGESGSPADAPRPARRRGEAMGTDAHATVWSLPGIVQPSVQPQTGPGSMTAQTVKAVAGQQTPESTAVKQAQKGFEPVAIASAVVNSGAGPTRTQQRTTTTQQVQPQTSGTERAATAGSAAAVSSKVAGSATQEVAPPAATGGKQVPAAARQASQEAATASVAQTGATGSRVARPDVGTEGTQPEVSATAAPTTQGNAKADAAGKAMPAALSPVAQEKTGQAPAKPQSSNSQQAGDSQTTPRQGQNASASSSDAAGHADPMAKSATAARREGAKGESSQREVKDAVVSGAREPGFVMPDSRASAGGESVSTAQDVASTARSQTSVDVPAARSPVQSVGEQILDSIRSSGLPGAREVTIRLNPPELGTVVVRFQEQGERLVGTLEASTREAQREIEQALPEVVRGLQEAGVQVRRVEVVTSDQPDRNLGGEHSPQDVWQQHQGAGQGREHSPASQTRWSQGMGERGAVRQGSFGDESQAAVAPGRIDVLL